MTLSKGDLYPGGSGYPVERFGHAAATSPHLGGLMLSMQQYPEKFFGHSDHAAAAPLDENWRPTPAAPGVLDPPTVRVGEAIVLGSPDRPPLLLPIAGKWHVALEKGARSVSAAKSHLLRSLGSVHPGCLKVLMYDLTGEFNDFNALGSDLLEHIPLGGLEAKINQLADVQHHILTKRHVAEVGTPRNPWQVLVVNGNPDISNKAREKLAYLVYNGTGWGSVLGIGTYIPDSDWVQRGYNGGADGEPDSVPPHIIRHNVAKIAGVVSAEHKKPFSVLDVNEGPLWGESVVNGLDVVVGRDPRTGYFIVATLGGETSHWFGGGRTNSGKSVLLGSAVLSLAKKYSPEDLEIYYMDGSGPDAAIFGSGPSDETYLPHLKVLAPNMLDPEFAMRVLRHVQNTIEERSVALGRLHARNFEELRTNRPNEKWPAILLVWDELQLILDDKQWGNDAVEILKDILKRGRKAGVHVFAATQETGSIKSLWGSEAGVMQQFGMRVALLGAEGVMSMLENDNLMHHVKLPGDAWFNDNGGKGPSNRNVLVRVPNVQTNDVETLKQAMWPHRPQDRRPLVTFDGIVPPVLEESPWYKQLVPVGGDSVSAFVGQEFSIDGQPAAVDFSDEYGRNLLVLGTKSQEIHTVFQTAAMSLAKQHPPKTAQFSIVCSDKRQLGAAEDLAKKLERSGHRVSVHDSSTADMFMLATAESLPQSGSGQKHYVFMYGADRLQRAASAAFKALAQMGPERGVHTLAAASSIDQAKQALGGGYDVETLKYFESRLLIDVPQGDVTSIAGHGFLWKSNDRPGRAVLSDERGDTRVMRLYA